MELLHQVTIVGKSQLPYDRMILREVAQFYVFAM